MLYRWFLDMDLMEPSFDATVFTKNRRRLLRHRVGRQLFEVVACEADRRGLMSDEHFSGLLVVYDSQSPLVSALLRVGEAWTSPGTGYFVGGIGGLGWRNEQALSLAEAAVEAAKSVFEEHFPDVSFGMHTRWD